MYKDHQNLTIHHIQGGSYMNKKLVAGVLGLAVLAGACGGTTNKPAPVESIDKIAQNVEPPLEAVPPKMRQ